MAEIQTIAVGSKNPVKVAAALSAFHSIFPDQQFAAEGFAVDSNVSDQPMSNEETLRGARNRAAALQVVSPEADFFVGIEGGVEAIGGQLFASAWMVIRDSLSGREAIGKSAVFALPPEVRRLIESGVELGLANDKVFSQHNSKHAGGAIGSLTGGVLGREELYHHAMLAALAPIRNPELFPA